MYEGVLLVHSWVRWVAVIAAVLAVGGAIVNLARHTAWRKGNDIASVVFISAADVQLLLGITLFVVGPPWFSMFAAAPAAAMKNDLVRYWTIEHGFGMVVAILIAHIGRAILKRRSDAFEKNRVAASWLGVALLIILITIPWPFMPYARPLVRM